MFAAGHSKLNRFGFALAAISGFLVAGPSVADDASVCFGTTSNGSLRNAWKLPGSGSNYTAYSATGRLFGRTYVHSSVHAVVVAAYAALAESMPGTVFVYGETGLKEGGRFDPHKTHQNGLSVDFMVPVLDRDDRSVPLPTGVFNKWGYDLEFDGAGQLDDFRIDYEAIAEHIYELHVAARKHGIGIWRVIFDPQLQPNLRETRRWPYLKANIEFSKRRSWVRHDEHYHVDFETDCEPVS